MALRFIWRWPKLKRIPISQRSTNGSRPWSARMPNSGARGWDMARARGVCCRSRLDRGARRGVMLTPSFRARALTWLARRFGAGFVLPTIAAAESRDSTKYDTQVDAVAGGLPADERSHARIISFASSTHRGLAGPSLARHISC